MPESIYVGHPIYRGRNVTVRLVNGEQVRKTINPEFTDGDNDAHSPEIVPHGEVWVDNTVKAVGRPYVTVHELYERNLMLALGFDYATAHAAALLVENACRSGQQDCDSFIRLHLAGAPAWRPPTGTVTMKTRTPRYTVTSLPTHHKHAGLSSTH